MVVHGPEAFDNGWVARITNSIGPVEIVVAGIMARTAAEESKIPVRFDCRIPSVIFNELSLSSSFLLNCAKSPQSGERFGCLVANRCHQSPLIQVECRSHEIIVWGEKTSILADYLARKTGFPITRKIPTMQKKDTIRTIGGCIFGEPVFVNGIIIGYATAEEVILSVEDNTLKAVSGIDLKAHGIEKLLRSGLPVISEAWCKSGRIRSSPPGYCFRTAPKTGRIVIIDHAAVDLYTLLTPEVTGILAIGDDTTAVCGHIGFHLGIPVFGITDGDRDDILISAYAPGSVIVHVIDGSDDDTGRELASFVPQYGVFWASWVGSMVQYLGERVIISLQVPE